MKLLILGGTQFVGRAVAEAALERGHELTLFHRGRTNPGLFPEAEHVHGDREVDLSPLAGRSWDAIIDTSGYTPEVVRASAAALAGTHYVFVSTIAVYADLSIGPDEDSPVYTEGDGYGERKAACERELPADALIVRPGLIVGPHDPTYRFTYWVDRIARGGDVVAPAPPGRRVQFIEARDLGEWLVRSADSGLTGVFNAVGPERELTMGEVLETCVSVTGSDARLHWLDPALLKEHGVAEWMGLPLWVYESEYRGMLHADNSRAVRAGLEFRPLVETVRDTLAWIGSGSQIIRDDWAEERPGLTPEREAELLKDAA
jgi:nucleoside-diphosphate-sugar epimerase